ncbi:hypothetical protein [Amycolatopsis sp. cmx-8-4]|uniref:hypothetical protein n=1 Tax=Amycolatopsis sp. cmx-8-4 TaxID=2790947 RepID=UPI00397B1B5C
MQGDKLEVADCPEWQDRGASIQRCADETIVRAKMLSVELLDMTDVSEASRQLTECAVMLLPIIERVVDGELFCSDLAGSQSGKLAQLWHPLRRLIHIPSLRSAPREGANPARERSW